MDYHGIHTLDNITAENSSITIGTSGTPFGTIYGETTSATYADLAEKYRCIPEQCEAGTVVEMVNSEEIDVGPCQTDRSMSVIGVISEQPAFKMNSRLEDGKYVALTGLVPVKVIGKIYKGEFIVATTDGSARKGLAGEEGFKIGVAQETNIDKGAKLVNCVIK